MASWASMNGSSTGGSNRNSASSCSSDGSFCAETDFAAAVTAAAQNAGIPVVGSPPAKGKPNSMHSDITIPLHILMLKI